MLGPGTLRLLDDLSDRAEQAFPEGGLLYKYTEASRRARIRFPNEFRTDSTDKLTESDLERVAVFICNTEGRLGVAKPDPGSVALASQLMTNLYADLEPSVVGVTVDDDSGHSWGISIHLLRDRDHRYSCLELWASID
ncbi:MAG: hypothetical protein ABW110_00625 [Steroidobacteraceae bacterium]